jgi:guanylate kinase
VSYTTRSQRPGETDGIDYHFVGRPVFDAMIAQESFAEWAEVHGNLYGTSLETLDRFRAEGCDILLDIDCQGAQQLKKNCREGVFIFILPPGLSELQRRLNGRNTDAPEVIARRIANARSEIREAVWYDYVVVNDEFDHPCGTLSNVPTADCNHQNSGIRINILLERNPPLWHVLP